MYRKKTKIDLVWIFSPLKHHINTNTELKSWEALKIEKTLMCMGRYTFKEKCWEKLKTEVRRIASQRYKLKTTITGSAVNVYSVPSLFSFFWGFWSMKQSKGLHISWTFQPTLQPKLYHNAMQNFLPFPFVQWRMDTKMRSSR